jgi:hypothetical protein
MPFHNDTIVPFVENGLQTQNTLTYLAQTFKAVDKPIRAMSLTKEAIIQEANAIQVGVTELANVRYTLTFSNGHQGICTASHKWCIHSANNVKQRIVAPITGFTFLATEFLAIGDRIKATNQNEYLEITGIASVVEGYTEYMCMKVPMFGNFLVLATAAEGQETTFIVSSTC